jgi:DNA polymerase III delta subunit
MIIFLYGPDDYRREEKRRWYIKEFEKKYSGLSVRTFDFAGGLTASMNSRLNGEVCARGVAGQAQPTANGKEDILEEFKSFSRSQSIFASKKLAVLENLYEADEEKLKETLPEIAAKKDTIVLCSERERPAKTLSFLLEKPAAAERFEFLSGYEWEIFIKTAAKELGLQLAESTLRFLAGVYRNNTWGLVTELEKISNLKKGVVEEKDLAGLDLEIAPDYWTLLDGLRNRDLKTRIVALEKLFEMGEPLPKVFNILASTWREKTPQMAEYDLKVKSGKLDYEEVLVDLAIS